MKTFTKIMLIIAGVFASVGVICMVAAFAMGLTSEHLVDMVQDGRFSFDEGDLHISFGDDAGNDLDVDLDTDIDIESNSEMKDESIYTIKEACRGMDIEFGAGVLDICYDDVEYIQVKQTNIPNLKVNLKNDILVITEGSDVNIDLDDIEDRNLIILIPKNMKFEEVELEIGASKADIKDIISKDISITVGAGQADVSKLTAKEFDLEVGAGQATAVQLDVEKMNVEAGIGQVNIALNGVQEEYNYNVECGIGNVTVGSASYGGLGAEQSIKHEGATKEINIECGIGEVKIKFDR